MIDVQRATLDNGLKIVHCRDNSTAMAVFDVIYNVGSRDEDPELTGMAHLFEHLMFGGSQNVANFDKALERAGGINNAWTSQDFTNFFDILPAHNIETAFWLESDRMLSLAFTEKSLDVQRHVVIEEFKQTHLNRPYGDLYHHLYPLHYTVHPYRTPTIGKEISHLERITLDDVRQWFFSHYAPDNAVIAVVGNVEFERVVDLANKWFGSIPSRGIAARNLPQEPAQTEPRRKTVTANVPQTIIVKTFPMPAHGEKGYRECDIITDLLAFGKSSRFFRNLVVGSKLFTEADASISGTDEAGMLSLTARLADNSESTIKKAEEMLIDEACRIYSDPESLTQRELTRSVNRYESTLTFSLMSSQNKATQLAINEMQHTDINSLVDNYRKVTTDDIRRTAQFIIDPNKCNTLVYRALKGHTINPLN